MGSDALGVEWQHGQLGRRMSNETVEEQEVFCMDSSGFFTHTAKYCHNGG